MLHSVEMSQKKRRGDYSRVTHHLICGYDIKVCISSFICPLASPYFVKCILSVVSVCVYVLVLIFNLLKRRLYRRGRFFFPQLKGIGNLAAINRCVVINHLFWLGGRTIQHVLWYGRTLDLLGVL